MDLAGARVRADEWRNAIADSAIVHGELQLKITLSAGVSAFPDHGSEIDTLVQCADLALYLSKHDGRNRVTCYQPQD